MFNFLSPYILPCLIYWKGEYNTNDLTLSYQLGLEGKKCYLIALKSRVKFARVIIHKANPNEMVHYVHVREGYSIVNRTDILEPQLGNIALPHPNSALHSL